MSSGVGVAAGDGPHRFHLTLFRRTSQFSFLPEPSVGWCGFGEERCAFLAKSDAIPARNCAHFAPAWPEKKRRLAGADGRVVGEIFSNFQPRGDELNANTDG
ncbi:unnamed protein product [Bursaphelenchus okinawaensis]|uniref:Uncharacterized protein n=1 Tax=Bursaphelenchus okinawaensis TaxID=465554 RepID=A0A811LV66_9BILA|nr:unnamed protein product [Bursaphelenchus okinawaensis]CAG9127848.1 unnamed protein product [Bursaphelenchus okinawaensis]